MRPPTYRVHIAEDGKEELEAIFPKLEGSINIKTWVADLKDYLQACSLWQIADLETVLAHPTEPETDPFDEVTAVDFSNMSREQAQVFSIIFGRCEELPAKHVWGSATPQNAIQNLQHWYRDTSQYAQMKTLEEFLNLRMQPIY